MKNRYEKFVFETEKGITFEVSEGTSEELIIKAQRIVPNNEPPTVSAGEYAEFLSVYTDRNGDMVPVPPGWTVSGAIEENTIWGKNEGLVIYRIPQEKVRNIHWSMKRELEDLQTTYDQFVWCPVEKLDSNGTIDGVSFTEKFGRRKYQNEEFSNREFRETPTEQFMWQLESVRKYGGFYFSRYCISRNERTYKPQSVQGVLPWTNIRFDEAMTIASCIEDNKEVKSHMPFGTEYDSVLEWFINSNARTLREIAKDSTNWGNYYNTKNSPRKVVKTGSKKECCTNNIYDLPGNVYEMTQEKKGYINRVVRGGAYNCWGNTDSVASRKVHVPNSCSSYISFRAVLCIK